MNENEILDSNQKTYDEYYAKEEVFLRYSSDWLVRVHALYLKKHRPTGRVLDFGCGGGNNACFFLEQGYDVFGVDTSKHTQALVMKNLRSRGLSSEHAEQFVTFDGNLEGKFEDESFDIVLCNQVLYYLSSTEKIQQVCEQFDRVLKPGGIVILTMMAPPNYYLTDLAKPIEGTEVVRVQFSEQNHRLHGHDQIIYPVRDEDHLRELFGRFKPLTIGYFDQKLFDIKSNFHYIFVGTKQAADNKLKSSCNMHKQPYAIMFHHFYDDSFPKVQGAIRASDLERVIHFLGRSNILDASEWLERYRIGTLLPGQVCFTFDDGLACQFEIAFEVLQKHKIQAIFFVCSRPLCGQPIEVEAARQFQFGCFSSFENFYQNFLEFLEARSNYHYIVERIKTLDTTHLYESFPFYSHHDKVYRHVRDEVLGSDRFQRLISAMMKEKNFQLIFEKTWMSRHELAQLNGAGHLLGLHSHSHPLSLGQLSLSEQARELEENYEALTEITQSPIEWVAYPRGSYDERTLTILKRMGVRYGFRSSLAGKQCHSLLEIAREDHSNIMRRIAHEDNRVYERPGPAPVSHSETV